MGVTPVIRYGAHLSKIRVLLADDNIPVLEYVREFVSFNCCEVVGAVTDGQAAVSAATQLLPDVVVLDLSMPVLNGIEAAKLMKDANPSIRIVFLTVEKDPDTCRAALEAGACGYVLKPRLATDLIPAIELARNGLHFVSPGCE
jgi:DNA-binding NarL/FixJ family response regulator